MTQPQPTEPTPTEKRILVLGSAPHGRQVTAYAWDELPADLNVADYDVVILNFVPLRDQEFASKVNQQKRFPDRDKFSLLLFRPGSEIIVIDEPVPGFARGWLPILPKFEYNAGHEVVLKDTHFEYYFRHVRRWSYHLAVESLYQVKLDDKQDEAVASCLKMIGPEMNALELRTSSVAETGYQRQIASKLRFQAKKAVRQFRKNNDPKNQVVRGRISTNHFSKPGKRSKRFSNSSMTFLVNLTPV
jgi:hypothetical protein